MKCLFGGNETSSREHVIPQWLQRRFNLQEQTIVISNGTSLKYKHLVVPATQKENNKFGEIEDRLAQGIYRLDELYLWALKIHIGLIFRDSSLRFDIRDQTSPHLLDIDSFDTEIALFRLLYNHWKGNGTTSPMPFGSVFILDSLLPQDSFDFFHCLVTGTIGIHLDGKFVVVFLWDQGDAHLANIASQWTNYHQPSVQSLRGSEGYEDHCYLSHHVWACESAYWLYRQRRAFNLIRTNDQLVLVPPLMRRDGRGATESEYSRICSNFGLELKIFKGEAANVYAPHKILLS